MDYIMIDKIHFKNVVSGYIGSKLVYGENDCNLIFTEIYEPEIHEILKNRYTTARGGRRVARKEFGISTIEEWLDSNSNYREIKPIQRTDGSIFVSSQDIGFVTGRHLAVFDTDGFFKLMTIHDFGESRFFERV